MIEELSPRQFLERRAAGDDDDAARRARGLGDSSWPRFPRRTLHIPMGQIAERLGELDPNARRS